MAAPNVTLFPSLPLHIYNQMRHQALFRFSMQNICKTWQFWAKANNPAGSQCVIRVSRLCTISIPPEKKFIFLIAFRKREVKSYSMAQMKKESIEMECGAVEDKTLNQFARAAVTKYHQPSDLKQHKFILSQFWRLEV